MADWTGQINQQSDRRGGPTRGGQQQSHAAGIYYGQITLLLFGKLVMNSLFLTLILTQVFL